MSLIMAVLMTSVSLEIDSSIGVQTSSQPGCGAGKVTWWGENQGKEKTFRC